MNFKRLFLKTYYFFENPIKRLYWFIVKPETKGAKILVQHGDKFLLVRLDYAHKKWTIPGGRVDKGETSEQAAVREAQEEVGIHLNEAKFIGSYFNIKEHKRDTVDIFHSIVQNSDFKVDGIEIKEAGWFMQNELPEDRVPRVDFIFGMLNQEKK